MLGQPVGLRFRKSVKLLPGVRLNLSTRGASMSLGRPGARLNISSRGVRATTGIPGTGLSYTTRLTGGSTGTRRRSSQQLAAEYRRVAAEKQFEAAQAQADQMEDELDGLLESWREIPSESEVRRVLQPQPFRHEVPEPEPLDAVAARHEFEQKVRDEVAARHGRPRHATVISSAIGTALFILVLALLSAVAGDALRTTLALSVGLVGALAVHATLVGRSSRGAYAQVTAKLAQWPERLASLEADFERESAAYHAGRDAAERDWTDGERDRIAFLERLLAGDVDAAEAAVSASLESIDFPFETQCDVAIPDPHTSYVHLDLPEIEDVVPEFRLKALKNGSVKEVKRKDRADAYARLAAGLALHIAGAIFAASPAMQTVHIGAYTQRKQRGSDRIGDDYVYDVTVTRTFIASTNPSTVDPMAALNELDARYEQKKNGEFKKIKAPGWVAELFVDDPPRSPLAHQGE